MMKNKILKVMLSSVIAFSLLFALMSVSLAAGTPSITVDRDDQSVTLTGSGFEDGQEVAILVLNDGVDSPEDIDLDNPINSIDYIDQVTADNNGEFSFDYTSRANVAVSQTLKIFATGGAEADLVIGDVVVEGNKISGTVKGITGADTTKIKVKLLKDGDLQADINADENGYYEFNDVAAGTYSLEFSRIGYLKLTVTNIVVDEDIEIGSHSLLAGDIDGSGGVTGADLSPLLSAWMQGLGDPKYAPELDFDDSGGITGADLSAILTNWMKADVIIDFSE